MSDKMHIEMLVDGVPIASRTVVPCNLPQQTDVLWNIAQKLTSTDVAYEYAGRYYCIFCGVDQYRDGLRYMTYPIGEEEEKEEQAYHEELIRDFPHAQDCIVVEACELLKQRAT